VILANSPREISYSIFMKMVLLRLYLERIMSWLKLGNVHPLAVDIMLVNVAAINGNTLVSIISTFVSKTITIFQIMNYN